MTVLKMLYVLIAQAKGRALITLDTHGGRGRTVKGQMAAPLLHTNTQLYHQTGNLVPKTPRACIQFVSSALRSRVQGKKPQGPKPPGKWGWGPGGTCLWQLLVPPALTPSQNVSITY